MDLVDSIYMINGCNSFLIQYLHHYHKFYMLYLMKCIHQMIICNGAKLHTINWNQNQKPIFNIGIIHYLHLKNFGSGYLQVWLKDL